MNKAAPKAGGWHPRRPWWQPNSVHACSSECGAKATCNEQCKRQVRAQARFAWGGAVRLC
eukprot:9196480-Alexandrium_andersonii.AAC.1